MKDMFICDICSKNYNKQDRSKVVATVSNGIIIHTCVTCLAKKLVKTTKDS
jgi:hypothetical protein